MKRDKITELEQDERLKKVLENRVEKAKKDSTEVSYRIRGLSLHIHHRRRMVKIEESFVLKGRNFKLGNLFYCRACEELIEGMGSLHIEGDYNA